MGNYMEKSAKARRTVGNTDCQPTSGQPSRISYAKQRRRISISPLSEYKGKRIKEIHVVT